MLVRAGRQRACSGRLHRRFARMRSEPQTCTEMLPLWSSRTPLSGGLVEHECPRCHRPVELPVGEICAVCRQAIERRARRSARLVAMTSTVALGVYVMLRVPPEPTARTVSGVAVGAWYLLTYLIARRVLREFLR